MAKEEWEAVDQASGDLQSEIIRSLLEAQGIPVLLSQEGAGRAMGLNVGSLGEVQILVPTSYKARAEELLRDYYSGRYEDEPELDAGEGEEL